MSAVHIYAPAPLATRVVWDACYGCKDTGRKEKRSPLLVRLFEWFDPEATCLLCGETLGHERPWSPGWRKRNIAWALAKAERLRWDVRSAIAMREAS